METEDREEYQNNIYIVILNWNYKRESSCASAVYKSLSYDACSCMASGAQSIKPVFRDIKEKRGRGTFLLPHVSTSALHPHPYTHAHPRLLKDSCNIYHGKLYHTRVYQSSNKTPRMSKVYATWRA